MTSLDGFLAKASKLDRDFRVMEFCGGHTHALVRSGLLNRLPNSIQMIHGPGCPVCVLPPNHLQALIDLLTAHPGLTAVVYGDVMRIPTLGGDSLLNAQGRGLPIKMVYSPLEILQMAAAEPNRDFVFLAIGFETTAPATALLLKYLKAQGLKNVSVLCLHVLTAPAMRAVMSELPGQLKPEALIGPGHVSLVTGIEPYDALAKEFGVPIVISGFTAQDLIDSLNLCLDHRLQGIVINQYARALKLGAQEKHRALLEEVFEVRPSFAWRGLGEVRDSAFRIGRAWQDWDAESKYKITYRHVPEHPACQCPAILRGAKRPTDCKLFAKACTPARPMGACMVSSEGACSALYQSTASTTELHQ